MKIRIRLPQALGRLRVQLALAMGLLTICAAFAIITFDTTRQEWQMAAYRERLPPDEQRIYDAIKNGDFTVLAQAGALYERMRQDSQALIDQDWAWLYATIAFGTVLIMAAGTLLAAYFGAPIESVARAARRVAAGDLSARAKPRRFMAVEMRDLVRDFNQMAENLERSDHELRGSNAAVAHELRTPLTILRGRLQGMQDGVFAAGEAELSALLKQVESLSRIVEDLRLLSLANSGRLHLEKTELDLDQEIESLLTVLTPDLEAAGLAVNVDILPIRCRADGGRLRQALLALLENVKRYAAEGGDVTVSLATDGTSVKIHVADRGPGLADAAKDAAFARFWRAEDSRSRRTGGTGLGLSVVRAIAQAHGGSVDLSDRAGGGLVASLRLPLA
jgi:two-component system sensor histidine kinase AdeS